MMKLIHKRNRSKLSHRILSVFIAVTFISSLVLPPSFAQGIQLLNLPAPGAMVNPSQGFVPVLLKGMMIQPDQPLRFDFIVDSGNGSSQVEDIKKESETPR